MDPARAPEPGRALAQWQNLHDTLKKLGVNLHFVDPMPDYPDMVFTANAGLVCGKTAVLAQFKYRERQGEAVGFQRWFEENGYAVVIPRTGSFEGEGDALFSKPDTLFCGFGFRSDRPVCAEVGKLVHAKDLIECELIDPYFYHLDTCFAPVTAEKAIIFPEAFTKDSLARMEKHIELLPVPEHDAKRFACNAVLLERDVIVPAGCPETEGILQGLGCKTHPVELDEYIKAGGAAKCLSLKI